MNDGVYPVGVSIRRDRLSSDGYVATVEGGHRKVRHLFAFGDTRKDAALALAKLIYETLASSRYDVTGLETIALIEAHVVRLPSAGGPWRGKR